LPRSCAEVNFVDFVVYETVSKEGGFPAQNVLARGERAKAQSVALLVENSSNSVTRQTDTGCLSRRGKGIALTLLALGLLTFFLPIIKFNPPAHGRQYWSVLDITLRLQATLHPTTPLVLVLFIPFGLVYLTLLVAMGTVLLVPFRKALRWINLAGLFLLYPFRGFFGAIRLAHIFMSARGGDLRTLWAVLGVTMLAVAAVAWTDTT
jgi:hypothetical protein